MIQGWVRGVMLLQQQVTGLNVLCAAAFSSPKMFTLFICGVLQVADRLEAAVNKALDSGYRTKDLYTEGTQLVKCSEMGALLEGYVA